MLIIDFFIKPTILIRLAGMLRQAGLDPYIRRGSVYICARRVGEAGRIPFPAFVGSQRKLARVGPRKDWGYLWPERAIAF